MARLKNLIVNGPSRFNGDSFFNTIKAGTWNGSTIDVAYGGTNKTSGVGSATQPVYLDATLGITACSIGGTVSEITVSNASLSASNWYSATTIDNTVNNGTNTFDKLGVYALKITTGASAGDKDVVYAGTFAIRGTTTSGSTDKDEIPLHTSPGISGETNRLYAATDGNNIYLSTRSDSNKPDNIKLSYIKLL